MDSEQVCQAIIADDKYADFKYDVDRGMNPQVSNIQAQVEAYNSRSIDFKTIMAILALAFSYEASFLSFNLPSAVLLDINAAIGPSTQYTWISTSWNLGTAVTQTIAGRCSDIFGRRNFFIGANLLGLIGCIIGSQYVDVPILRDPLLTFTIRANTINTAIAGAVLMGLASGPQHLAFAGTSEIVPRKNRGQAASVIALTSLPGSSFGTVIAYALIAHLSWRWTFYLGAISNGIALVLTAIFYWPPGFVGLHPNGKTRLQQFKELDFVGLILFGGGLTSFLLGISWGGAPYPWASAHVLAPLILGALSFAVAFPLWEVLGSSRVAKLCPPHMFTNVRGFTLPVAVMISAGMSLFSLVVLWPQAGLFSGGFFFSIIKRTKIQFITVVMLQAVFLGLMATVNQHTPRRAIAFVAIAGFNIGASQCMAILIVQFGAKDSEIGVATGILGSARSCGGAIATALYSTILRSQVKQNLVPKVTVAATQAGLPKSSLKSFLTALASGSSGSLSAVKGVTPEIIEAGIDAKKSVYARGFQLIFLVCLAFAGLACIGAFFVNSVDDKLTQHVAVKVDAPHLIHGRNEAKVVGEDEN